MESKIPSLAATLATRDAEWDVRVRALDQLGTALCAAPARAGDAAVRDGVAAQLGDLRSAVVRAACSTVERVAERLGAGAEPLADALVEPLLRVLASSNRVMCAAAERALRTVLVAARVAHRGLDALCAALRASKHAPQRVVAADSLARVLELARTRYDRATLDAHADALCAALRAGMADSAPAVRKAARQAFFPLRVVWPERAAALEKSLDPQQRKYLATERFVSKVGSQGGSTSIVEDNNDEKDDKEEEKEDEKQEKKEDEKSARGHKRASPNEALFTRPQSVSAREGPLTAGKGGILSLSIRSLAAAATVPPKAAQTAQTAAAAEHSEEPFPPPVKQMRLHTSASISGGSSTGTPQSTALRTPLSASQSDRTPAAVSAAAASLSGRKPSSSSGVAPFLSTTQKAVLSSIRAKSSNSAISSASSKSKTSETTLAAAPVAPATVSQRTHVPPKPPVMPQSQPQPQPQQQQPLQPEAITAESPVGQIVAALTSRDRATCVAAFASMSRVIAGARCYEVSPELGRVTAALRTQLGATDGAVVGGALQLLRLMLQRYKGVLFALDELLPAVFRQYARAAAAADGAEVTRALCAVLEEMLNSVDADFLVPSLARAMERGDRACVRTGLVMLKNVMGQLPEYFDAPHHIRPHIGLLVRHAAAADAEIASMARQVLVGLFQQSPAAFTSAVWQLPYDDKKELRRIVPGLDAELSSRIARRPEVVAPVAAPVAPVVPAASASAAVMMVQPVSFHKVSSESKPVVPVPAATTAAASEVAVTTTAPDDESSSTSPRLREYLAMAAQAGSTTYPRAQLVACLSGLLEATASRAGAFGAGDVAACVAAAGVWAGSAHEPYVRCLALALLRGCAAALALTPADVEGAVATLLAAACDLDAPTQPQQSQQQLADRARAAVDGCARALEQRFAAPYLVALMRLGGLAATRAAVRAQCLDRLARACATVAPVVLRGVAAELVAALAPLFDAPEDVLRRKASACVAEWARTLQDAFTPLLDTLPPLKRKIVQLVLQGQHQRATTTTTSARQ